MTDNSVTHSISFIIPVLNGAKFIRQCLDHIIAEMDASDELIVVDNGSTDGTVDIVKEYEQVKLLQLPRPTIAASRNHAAAAASGLLYAFIDSDVLVCEGWRAEVESVLTDDSIHATGSRYAIGEPAHWIEKAWYAKKSKEITRINYINSGNLIVRKEIFQSLGGFDEKLVTDEDCDFGERLNRSGFVIVEAPQIKAIHLGNPKSLRGFYGKEKWHATSSLNSFSQGRPDKPTVMTIAFMLSLLAATGALVFDLTVGGLPGWLIPMLILAIPIITAIYRIMQYRAFKQFPALVVLYLVFYFARCRTIGEFLYNKGLAKIGFTSGGT